MNCADLIRLALVWNSQFVLYAGKLLKSVAAPGGGFVANAVTGAIQRFWKGSGCGSQSQEDFTRITEKLVFNRLTYDDQLEIARLLLANELKFLRDKGHELVPADVVLPFLVRRGYHPRLGARPMRDAVEKCIGDALAEFLLMGKSAGHSLDVNESYSHLFIH